MSGDVWQVSDLAWAAGFVDGEGHLGIREQKGHFYISVSVAQVDPRPLLKLQHLFGGNLRLAKRQFARDIWAYNITTRAAGRMLSAISPYLVVKYELAELLMQFQATVGLRGAPVALDTVRVRVALKDSVDALNQRGR